MQTESQYLESQRAAKKLATVATVAPKAIAAAKELEVQATALSAEAQALIDAKHAAVRQIERNTELRNEIATQIEALSGLQAIAENREAIAHEALENFAMSRLGSDPTALARWTYLSDELMRAALVAPFVQKAIESLRSESERLGRQITEICTKHGFDESRLRETLRNRQPDEPITVFEVK